MNKSLLFKAVLLSVALLFSCQTFSMESLKKRQESLHQWFADHSTCKAIAVACGTAIPMIAVSAFLTNYQSELGFGNIKTDNYHNISAALGVASGCASGFLTYMYPEISFAYPILAGLFYVTKKIGCQMVEDFVIPPLSCRRPI